MSMKSVRRPLVLFLLPWLLALLDGLSFFGVGDFGLSDPVAQTSEEEEPPPPPSGESGAALDPNG